MLQGFSKEYVLKAKELNNNKLLSQAGNAMTVNVIREIGKCLLKYIEVDNLENETDTKRLSNC